MCVPSLELVIALSLANSHTQLITMSVVVVVIFFASSLARQIGGGGGGAAAAAAAAAGADGALSGDDAGRRCRVAVVKVIIGVSREVAVAYQKAIK